MRYHVYKWNNYKKQNTMLILTEDDIENKSDEWCGCGFEIVIIPSKYKDIHNEYLKNIIICALSRNGEIIFV